MNWRWPCLLWSRPARLDVGDHRGAADGIRVDCVEQRHHGLNARDALLGVAYRGEAWRTHVIICLITQLAQEIECKPDFLHVGVRGIGETQPDECMNLVAWWKRNPPPFQKVTSLDHQCVVSSPDR